MSKWIYSSKMLFNGIFFASSSSSFSSLFICTLDASVRLLLPPNLSENDVSRYPLLIHVYAGPGSQLVTSKYRVDWGHYLASNRNIIYGVIDGRGSANKGDKLLYSMYKKLGTVEVEDQIRVTR